MKEEESSRDIAAEMDNFELSISNIGSTSKDSGDDALDPNPLQTAPSDRQERSATPTKEGKKQPTTREKTKKRVSKIGKTSTSKSTRSSNEKRERDSERRSKSPHRSRSRSNDRGDRSSSRRTESKSPSRTTRSGDGSSRRTTARRLERSNTKENVEQRPRKGMGSRSRSRDKGRRREMDSRSRSREGGRRRDMSSSRRRDVDHSRSVSRSRPRNMDQSAASLGSSVSNIVDGKRDPLRRKKRRQKAENATTGANDTQVPSSSDVAWRRESSHRKMEEMVDQSVVSMGSSISNNLDGKGDTSRRRRHRHKGGNKRTALEDRLAKSSSDIAYGHKEAMEDRSVVSMSTSLKSNYDGKRDQSRRRKHRQKGGSTAGRDNPQEDKLAKSSSDIAWRRESTDGKMDEKENKGAAAMSISISNNLDIKRESILRRKHRHKCGKTAGRHTPSDQLAESSSDIAWRRESSHKKMEETEDDKNPAGKLSDSDEVETVRLSSLSEAKKAEAFEALQSMDEALALQEIDEAQKKKKSGVVSALNLNFVAGNTKKILKKTVKTTKKTAKITKKATKKVTGIGKSKDKDKDRKTMQSVLDKESSDCDVLDEGVSHSETKSSNTFSISDDENPKSAELSMEETEAPRRRRRSRRSFLDGDVPDLTPQSEADALRQTELASEQKEERERRRKEHREAAKAAAQRAQERRNNPKGTGDDSTDDEAETDNPEQVRRRKKRSEADGAAAAAKARARRREARASRRDAPQMDVASAEAAARARIRAGKKGIQLGDKDSESFGKDHEEDAEMRKQRGLREDAVAAATSTAKAKQKARDKVKAVGSQAANAAARRRSSTSSDSKTLSAEMKRQIQKENKSKLRRTRSGDVDFSRARGDKAYPNVLPSDLKRELKGKGKKRSGSGTDDEDANCSSSALQFDPTSKNNLNRLVIGPRNSLTTSSHTAPALTTSNGGTNSLLVWDEDEDEKEEEILVAPGTASWMRAILERTANNTRSARS